MCTFAHTERENDSFLEGVLKLYILGFWGEPQLMGSYGSKGRAEEGPGLAWSTGYVSGEWGTDLSCSASHSDGHWAYVCRK